METAAGTLRDEGSKMKDDEKSIEELCKPISATTSRAQYTIGGKPMPKEKERQARDLALQGAIRRKRKYKI